MPPTLEAKIALNAAAFNRGMNSLKGNIVKLGGVIAGAFSVYKVNSFIDGMDSIAKASRKLAVSSSFYQKMQFAAEPLRSEYRAGINCYY